MQFDKVEEEEINLEITQIDTKEKLLTSYEWLTLLK